MGNKGGSKFQGEYRRRENSNSNPAIYKNLKADTQQIIQKLIQIEGCIKRSNEKPLTFKEACAYLGYSSSNLYKLTYKNLIPHYKPMGKMIFFSKIELDEWIFKSSVERRVLSDELKDEKKTERDPNQVDMFEKNKVEEEKVIEFPLKSRRKTLRQAQGDKE